ncbi:hypothetical protein TMES_19385 [Thalassospira mesophila]|uniref:4Fe-4S ferredoxin-type domain-containing protein n=1 Tax=Thalassospira mesophila TaxID=1293891 RepID=A0A1Y2KXP6_9PROT|nr:hypothetical protein TMES_19385 [Thalassospira mesophila]
MNFVKISRTQRFAGAIENFFSKNRRHLGLVHLGMFGVFIVLIFVPPFLPAPLEHSRVFDNFQLFANSLLWGAWFPLVLLSVVVTGRSWCGLFCPMGAASEWASGRGLGRRVPGWLKSPAAPIVSFVFVTIWAQTLGARDHAQSAAILFGCVMLAAFVCGLVFGRKKRVWCRHACPIGLLLGVYARLGAVDFKPKRFVAGGDRWTEATACPTMIDLKRKSESRHCIECFRCVSPNAKGGLEVQLRRPGAELETIRHHNGNLAEVLFLFISAGVALGGFLWLVLGSYQDFRLWLATEAIKRGWLWVGSPGPSWLMAVFSEEREVFRWVDFLTITGYMAGWIMICTLVLSFTTGVAAWLVRRAGGTGTFHQCFVALGYQVAPVSLVSLVLGLGNGAFINLALLGLSPAFITTVKLLLFVSGAGWSLHLGNRILASFGVRGSSRVGPLLCGAAGSVFLASAWYPALFG